MPHQNPTMTQTLRYLSSFGWVKSNILNLEGAILHLANELALTCLQNMSSLPVDLNIYFFTLNDVQKRHKKIAQNPRMYYSIHSCELRMTTTFQIPRSKRDRLCFSACYTASNNNPLARRTGAQHSDHGIISCWIYHYGFFFFFTKPLKIHCRSRLDTKLLKGIQSHQRPCWNGSFWATCRSSRYLVSIYDTVRWRD